MNYLFEVHERIRGVRDNCTAILEGRLYPTPDVLLSMTVMLLWASTWQQRLGVKYENEDDEAGPSA